MKTRILLFAFFFISFASVNAQRFAYVDSKYILESMPSYAEAMDELNALSTKWQETVEAKYDALEQMEKAYEAERILLTPDMRKKREDEIAKKTEEAKKYQKSKFGVGGELFSKQQELIKPLQDEVFEAIKEVAKARSYAMIFDKAGGSANILYSDPRYDKSEDVLRELGVN